MSDEERLESAFYDDDEAASITILMKLQALLRGHGKLCESRKKSENIIFTRKTTCVVFAINSLAIKWLSALASSVMTDDALSRPS